MSRRVPTILAAAALLFSGAHGTEGCVRVQPFAPVPLVPSPPPFQPAAAACTPVKIYSIDAANLEFHGASATIKAEGTASTAGWHAAELAFVSEDGAAAIYDFVACPPAIGAEVLTRISAATLVGIPVATLHRIVIRAQTNRQTLDVDEFRRGAIHTPHHGGTGAAP